MSVRKGVATRKNMITCKGKQEKVRGRKRESKRAGTGTRRKVHARKLV